jgi:hypothetical protein
MEFFINLPQILNDFNCNEEMQIWEIYVVLRKICCIIASEIIYEESLNKMDKYVEYFLDRFKQSFPEESITPKMHFLCHYSKCIRRYGPLYRYSTMRFERKHSYFKTLVQRLRNSKNITLSLCKRHQRSVALMRDDLNEIYYEKSYEINILELDSEIKNFLPENMNCITALDKCSLFGTEIQVNEYYLIKKERNIICRIKYILIHEQNYYLIAENYNYNNFNLKYFSYIIQKTSNHSLITINDFIYHRKLQTFTLNKKLFVQKVCEM